MYVFVYISLPFQTSLVLSSCLKLIRGTGNIIGYLSDTIVQNVSGGEPDEVQVNVILDPRKISTVANDDDDMTAVITGAAV